MSRIGKSPISIPSGVEVSVSSDNVVSVKSSKGTLRQRIHTDAVKVNVSAGQVNVLVDEQNQENETKAFHGLYRVLIANMIEGLSKGFEKKVGLKF